MQQLTDSVGPRQTNARHDVALVQAALKIVTNRAGQPYLSGGIDGVYGGNTQAAIDGFQRDHSGDGVPIAPGVAMPGGATVTAIAGLLPNDKIDLRILIGQKIVYLGRPKTDAVVAARTIQGNVGLRPVFRGRVADLVTRMHSAHGLVLSLTPSGARRTFGQQSRIGPPNSYAGPGESNHNYGNAVDLGFNDTTWLRDNGQPVTDDHWLRTLEQTERAQATALWDARDAIALNAPIGLFRLQMERIHLQDFDGANTSMGRSLAAHLNNSGAWGWRAARYDRGARDWHYSSDLGGTTGTFVEIGTANQIWNGNAAVTAAEITRAGWQRPPPAGAPPAAGPAAPPITRADIQAVKSALHRDFQAAEQAWNNWTPVP